MPLAVFGKPKRGISGPEIYPEKLRTPISEFIAENLPTKKPQTDRTLKKPQNKEGQSPKKKPRKKRAAFPPKTYRKTNRFMPERFGSAIHISVPIRFLILHHTIYLVLFSASSVTRARSGPQRPATREQPEREREGPGGKTCVREPPGAKRGAPANNKALGSL